MLDFPLESYVPLVSCAVATGGLIVRFFLPAGPAKQTLIAAVLIFLLLASTILWRKDHEAKQRARELGEEIVKLIGNEKRSFEEILSGLRQPHYKTATTAIDELIKENRLGSEDAIIVDKSDKQYRIRLYFVRSF